MSGTVKWFSNTKGYGFINGEDEREYFVHFRSILVDGYKTLREGQAVHFEARDSERGPVAANVAIDPS